MRIRRDCLRILDPPDKLQHALCRGALEQSTVDGRVWSQGSDSTVTLSAAASECFVAMEQDERMLRLAATCECA